MHIIKSVAVYNNTNSLRTWTWMRCLCWDLEITNFNSSQLGFGGKKSIKLWQQVKRMYSVLQASELQIYLTWVILREHLWINHIMPVVHDASVRPNITIGHFQSLLSTDDAFTHNHHSLCVALNILGAVICLLLLLLQLKRQNKCWHCTILQSVDMVNFTFL